MKSMAELPYRTSNDLPEGVRALVIDLLNQRLADAIDLSAQADAQSRSRSPARLTMERTKTTPHRTPRATAGLAAR
jgi:hypothetical protein